MAFEDGDHGQVVALEDGWTRVGRNPSAHICLDDPTISRRHLLLHRDDDGVKVLDDRSLNGVFHNGKRIEQADLSDGDMVSIGRFTLHFVHLAAEPSSQRMAGTAGG